MPPRTALFQGRPSVVGHRGLGQGEVTGHRENTLPSLLAAVALGVDWVELDVSRSRDDVLLVHHGPSTADGRFLVDLTAPELAAAGIPTLDEVLGALPAELPLDIDIKPVLEDATARPAGTTVGLLAPVLAREASRRPLLVTSFDAAALLRVREAAPEAALGLLTWLDFPLRMGVTAAAGFRFDVVGLHHGSFAANRVEPERAHRDPAYSVAVAHDAGLEVLAWCPPEPVARALVAAGVDAVCINDVPTVIRQVRGWSAGGGGDLFR